MRGGHRATRGRRCRRASTAGRRSPRRSRSAAECRRRCSGRITGYGGKCLDVTAAGTADGTKVQLYACNGSGAQVRQHRSDGELVNPASGKCLDASGPSSANGTRLQIWTCYASANQQWTLPS
ncbi:ricin-type beta-trefoil lectin domain protein [Streptomyces sp. NPDC058319]|uniref:ricin-type beta-trefoil lectin domain protein n=1 Tax=unclassified Streptomyces TaxID=2593676 RepID=UPI0036E293A0